MKKGVNWALRQIGKRNLNLHRSVMNLARQMQQLGGRSARWIAADAIRELESPAVLARLKSRTIAQ